MTETKGRLKKRWLVISGVALLGVVVLIIYALSSNAMIKASEAGRDLRLMNYENSKFWVMEDIRDYLKVKDETSYQDAVTDAHMTSDLQKELYGTSFVSKTFWGATTVNFLDAQYTFENEGTVKYYFVLTAEKSGSKQSFRFLASVKNNQIYDLVAY